MRRIAGKPTLAALVSIGLMLFGWQGVAQAAGVPGTWTQTDVNTATQAGVAYIDSQQNLDGSFGSIPIAETGMALVAYSVVQNGSFSNLSPSYQLHVQNAITYLLGQQAGDGSWSDFGFYFTYSTGIALAGLSAFTTVNAAVPTAIANGRTFLINEFQGPVFTGCSSADGSPTSYYCGGWNYENLAGRSDESNTGFAMFGLRLTGGVPAAIGSVNIGWQHHIQVISTNPFATRNDGGGSYEPFSAGGAFSFSSNANDTGTMLFGLAYDGVAGTDPNVLAGLKLGNDVLDEYELASPAGRTMVFHTGAIEDGTCVIGAAGCDWNFASGEGGYHYSLFSLTKGLGEYIAPNLSDATNWYAKVVDLLLTQQNTDGSWPQDGRDDGTTLMATAFAVAALGLVAVEQPISNANGVPVSATEGTPFCGPVATFDDADQNAVLGDYTAMIDWGDGTSTGMVSGGNGHFTVIGCHTYTEEGTYTVKVTITDADNSQNSATVTTTAIVSDATLYGGMCAIPMVSGQAFAGPTATFNDNDLFGMSSDYIASINWGDSFTSNGSVTGGPGHGPYTVNGAHTYTSTGPFIITITIRDTGGAPPITITCSNVLIFAFAPGGGSFAIGNLENTNGNLVYFWGAQWWKNNPTSTGSGVPSFKGFAENPSTPICGATWSADPGNSTPPPNGPLPAYMGVIVTSQYSKSGSQISGNIVHIVIVKTNPGYAPNPGHAGTGTVVAVVC